MTWSTTLFNQPSFPSGSSACHWYHTAVQVFDWIGGSAPGEDGDDDDDVHVKNLSKWFPTQIFCPQVNSCRDRNVPLFCCIIIGFQGMNYNRVVECVVPKSCWFAFILFSRIEAMKLKDSINRCATVPEMVASAGPLFILFMQKSIYSNSSFFSSVFLLSSYTEADTK